MATKDKKEKKVHKTSVAAGIVRGEQMGARRGIIEELFNDMYHDRRGIYWMNFFRGIFFGAGSALGGTIILGLVIWVLSLFINVPGIGQTIQDTTDAIKVERTK